MQQRGIMGATALALGLLATGAVAALAGQAQAQVVYANTFDAEAGGITAPTYTGFEGLTVTRGTVDVVKSGDAGITCAGGAGSCVDMDGSIFDPAGQLTSNSYAFGAGQTTTLSFLMSGNQRGVGEIDFADAALTFGGLLTGTWGYSANGVVTDMGSFSATGLLRAYTFIATDPFAELTLFFTPDSAGTVSFALGTSSNNGSGPILDNVSLSIAGAAAVPEPATWAVMILGFGAVGATARRRQAGAAVIA